MLKIENGRRTFWQWDTGQRLIVDEADCAEVQFYSRHIGTTEAYAVYTENGVSLVDVPDWLLQVAAPFVVFAYVRQENGQYTKRLVSFQVNARPLPPDYAPADPENHVLLVSLALTDRTTGKVYNLYVDNGKLTMAESEE